MSNHKPKKTYSDEYKANRRKNQLAWLAKKRQDPEWVKKRSEYNASRRKPKVADPIVEPTDLPPTVEQIKARIQADIGKINRLRLMYRLFDPSTRELAGLINRKNSDDATELVDIGEDALKALKERDVMPFVDEFKYQLYVYVPHKDGTKEQLGPYDSPAQVRAMAGGLRPLAALKRALLAARANRRTKPKRTPHK